MVKTGLKSFFCSFVLSLFVFFGINKVCFDAPQTSSPLIPRQNISLFLKDKKPSPLSKIQKISLFKSVDVVQKDLNPEIMVENLPVDEISAPKVLPVEENEQNISEAQIKKEKNISNTKKAHKLQQVVVAEKPKPVKEAHKQPQQHTEDKPTNSVKVLKVTENIPLSKPIQTDNSYSISKTEKQVLASLLANDNLSPEVMHVADASSKAENPERIASSNNDESLLIPLEKSHKLPQFASQKIKINPDNASSQVAMLGENKPISAVVEDGKKVEGSIQANDSLASHWQTMAQINDEESKPREIKDMYQTSQVETLPDENKAKDNSESKQDSPWVAAKSTAFPKNSEVIKQKFYKDKKAVQEDDSFKLTKILKTETEPQNTSGSEVKVAGEVLDNIIIPIPQDILDNKDLMPNLVSDPKNKKLEDELLAKERGQQAVDTEDVPFIAEEKNKTLQNDASPKEEKSIFKSIASFFSSDDKNEENSDENAEFYEADSQKNSQVEENSSSHSAKKTSAKRKILPSEIRLAFQPEKAEISGKTLDWIRAFGQKALEEDDVVLEIRIDGTASIALQQKRLNLLYNILTNLGLGYDKVNTVFTSRAPNTFILRVVKAGEDSDKKRLDPASFYYRKW